MRSYRNLIVLAVVSAALVVPVCSTIAGARRTVVDRACLRPAWSVFPDMPGADSPYDTSYSREFGTEDGLYPDAEGDIVVRQPVTEKEVSIDIVVTGMIPSDLHTVYFNMDGITDGVVSTAAGNALVGAFTTDADGKGHYLYEATEGTLASGNYEIAVFINGTASPYRRTLLISKNVQFRIK